MLNMSLVLLSAALLGGAHPSRPTACEICSCAKVDAPRIALDSSDAVFSARVVALDDRPIPSPDVSSLQGEARHEAVWAYLRQAMERLRVTLEVRRVWKGDIGDRIDIYTANECCICGYNFELGKEYLIYAYRLPSGRLVTSICSRTRPMTEAWEDLAELGAGVQPSRFPIDFGERPLD